MKNGDRVVYTRQEEPRAGMYVCDGLNDQLAVVLFDGEERPVVVSSGHLRPEYKKDREGKDKESEDNVDA